MHNRKMRPVIKCKTEREKVQLNVEKVQLNLSAYHHNVTGDPIQKRKLREFISLCPNLTVHAGAHVQKVQPILTE